MPTHSKPHISNPLSREAHIIIHGQSVRFRIIKYIVLTAVAFLIYRAAGWRGVGYFIGIGFVLGVTLHMIVRWKTDGWRKDWGLFKTPLKD